MQNHDDPLLEAIRAARVAGDVAAPSAARLEAYLHGELDELDQARMRRALAHSPALREELLALAGMLDDEAEAVFRSLRAPTPPRRPRRRIRARWLAAAAAAAAMLLATFGLVNWWPRTISAGAWEETVVLREDQFLPLRLRSSETASSTRYESPRIAVTAALLECFEWDDQLHTGCTLALLDPTSLHVEGLQGLAAFDPQTRSLGLLPLDPSWRRRLRLSTPPVPAREFVVLGWWSEDGRDYRARILGRWEP